jgi:hypothetical protein
MATKKQVLDALRARYDYYASEAVLGELMEAARVNGEEGFSGRDISKIADSLTRTGVRAENAVGALNALSEAEKEKEKAAPAKKAPAKKAPAKKAPAKKASTKK